MRAFLWSMAVAAAALAPARGDDLAGLGPVRMDAYTQTLVVTFRSEADARRARLGIAPLYHDLRLAFSTRMDDSTVNDLVVPGVMARYGQKGTFYLNRLSSWYQDSPATGIAFPKDPAREIPPRLLAGGSSIGGHTLSHDFLPSLSKNDAFREIMGVRVALESQAGTPVNSFVFPFVAFQEGDLRNGAERRDLEEILRRSGYYQLAEHRYAAGRDCGLQDAVFITLDNKDGGGAYTQGVLTQRRPEGERPLFLVTMHAWVSSWGAPDFPALARIYARWSGRADWWYCNQNQYAAYRYQLLHSRLTVSQRGRAIRAVLVRPDPLDLGDWVPLTLRVDGVDRGAVVAVSCPSAATAPVAVAGAYGFDLFHDRNRGPVEAYGESDNPANAEDLGDGGVATEGLRAVLHRDGDRLLLLLRNASDQPLRDLRATFRLPLRWREGVVRMRIAAIAAGQAASVEVPLTQRAGAEEYSVGPEYDVAQVDFVGARRARVYATCESPGCEPPAFFARNGFWMLGPLAGDEADFDPLAFATPFLLGAAPRHEYAVHWSGRLAWRALEPTRASILDPDIIPTTAKGSVPKFNIGDPSVYFPHANAQYILYGRIVSPDERTVRVVLRRDSVRRLSLNGRLVEGDELRLAKGDNDLRILYAPAMRGDSSFDESNYGCYLRLVDAHGQRVRDIRFERPPAP